MRLDPKRVHPSIFAATDAVAMKMASGTVDAGAVNRHQSEWMKEYGKGCAVWSVVGTAAFLGAIPIANSLGKPWSGILMLSILVILVGGGIYGMVRNFRQMTVGELEALLPVLDVSPTQHAYAETVVALHRSGRPKEEIHDAMAALNALLDEEDRLLSLVSGRNGDGRSVGSVAMLEERARLAERAEAARDDIARDAFAQSLSLLDERMLAVEARGNHEERIEAHLELLRQAVFATRDAARRLSSAPSEAGVDLSTDSLRSAVALARAQTQATEQALAELRAI